MKDIPEIAQVDLDLPISDSIPTFFSELFLRQMMGPSDAVKRIASEVECVAKSDFCVLILGESGSGKELVANAIHKASRRSMGPFIAIDCGAIPETLLESELFGHEKGAFTGAVCQKIGKFELARGGTLFLDEISNMPLASQAKLLRVLQEKEIHRVGGIRTIPVDVRILVATNEELAALAASRRFRHDLFFRINEFTITLPPLRMRKDDVLCLAKRFLDDAKEELRKTVKGFSKSAVERIIACDWPGNVRQLRSTIRRAVLLANEEITPEHLDISAPAREKTSEIPPVETVSHGFSLKMLVKRSIAAVERGVIIDTLRKTGGNKAKAARLLRIDNKTIYTKMRLYSIKNNGGIHYD